MRIGRHDIKLLAIIGAAGAAGLVATGLIIDAAEGPHGLSYGGDHAVLRYHLVHVQEARADRGRTQVQVIRTTPAATKSVRIVGSSLDLSPVVYIDGVRVNPPPPLYPGEERQPSLDELTPEDIAKIDVIKGDKALEFGTEAKERGVILVTTKTGRKKDSGEGS